MQNVRAGTCSHSIACKEKPVPNFIMNYRDSLLALKMVCCLCLSAASNIWVVLAGWSPSEAYTAIKDHQDIHASAAWSLEWIYNWRNNLGVLGTTCCFDYMWFFSINTTKGFSKQTDVFVISASAIKTALLVALLFLWHLGLCGWLLALQFGRICRTEQKEEGNPTTFLKKTKPQTNKLFRNFWLICSFCLRIPAVTIGLGGSICFCWFKVNSSVVWEQWWTYTVLCD